MAKLDQGSITDAALQIIEDPEIPDLTLSAIARALGVTQPALYYHVAGIEDILRWVGIAVRAQLVQLLSAATIGRSRGEAVHSISAAWLAFSQDHPDLYRSTNWHPVQGCPELEAAVNEVLSVLARSLRSYGLSDDDQANSALALRSMLHGFSSFEIGAGNPSPSDVDDSFNRVIDLVITGVEALASNPNATLAAST